jgi:hypothetical protein
VQNKNWQEIIRDVTRGVFKKKLSGTQQDQKKYFKETTLAR